MATEQKYYVFYKPYNVLTQFSKERPEHVTLADYMKVEKDIYPVGRLDKDSEGLLILTNDKGLNSKLLLPSFGHKRSYIVQLDNDISDKAISALIKGVNIKLSSGVYNTQPCSVKKLHKAPVLPNRDPPIRFRQNIPTSWALIELTEGKNRQVRKMFAEVGFPVLRLVRVQIEDLKIGKLQPGKYIEIEKEELFKLLKIESHTKDKSRHSIKRSSVVVKKSSPKKSAPTDLNKKQEGFESGGKRSIITTNLSPTPKSKKKSDGHAPWQKPKPNPRKKK